MVYPHHAEPPTLLPLCPPLGNNHRVELPICRLNFFQQYHLAAWHQKLYWFFVAAAEFCHIVRQLMGFFWLLDPNFLKLIIDFYLDNLLLPFLKAGQDFIGKRMACTKQMLCPNLVILFLFCILSRSLGALTFKRDEFKVDCGDCVSL